MHDIRLFACSTHRVAGIFSFLLWYFGAFQVLNELFVLTNENSLNNT